MPITTPRLVREWKLPESLLLSLCGLGLRAQGIQVTKLGIQGGMGGVLVAHPVSVCVCVCLCVCVRLCALMYVWGLGMGVE